LPVIVREWERIDAFVAQVDGKRISVDSAPFLHGAIDSKLEAEGRRLCQEREDEHRRKWKNHLAQPTSAGDVTNRAAPEK
jgi:hypothetical protein